MELNFHEGDSRSLNFIKQHAQAPEGRKMSEIIHFSDFRFNSLRKFMAPLYAELNQRSQATPTDQEKEAFVQHEIVPKFYQRMRLYRNCSLEDLADASKNKFVKEDLESFERGQIKMNPDIDALYCKVCHGDHERIYFWHQVRAFYRPSIRESEIAMAKDVFIKYGLTSAYVDYQNLNAERGKVLELKR